MKKQYLAIIFCALSASSINAQIVNIPDANFKNYLLGVNYINTNLDAEIQVSEAQAYSSSLILESMNISDLTGIEAFVNITSLNVAVNNLSSIDVSQNVDITNLRVANNPLTTLDVSANTAITSLDVANCQLTTIDLTTNSNLTAFSGVNNQFTSINVANGNNSIITYFYLVNNANLECIQVDDEDYCNTNWIGSNYGKPNTAFFSEDCSATVSLIAQFPFTGNAQDAVGTNHGTVQGNASLTEDRFGNVNSAYAFDGIDDYIFIPAAALPLGTSDFAISFWAYIPTTHFSTALLQKHDGGALGGMYIEASGGTGNQQIGTVVQSNNVGRANYTSVNLSEWHHIVLNHDYLVSDELYVDGALISSEFSNYIGNPIGSNSALLTVGKAQNTSAYFTGKIDDISIYNGVLSAGEIADLYTPGTAGLEDLNKRILVYPNPASNILNVQVLEPSRAEIHSLSGNVIQTIDLLQSLDSIDIQQLAVGVYFLKIGNSTVKFIKE